MESPRAPMELGYPVRFGAGTAATVPRASKIAGRPLRNRPIVPSTSSRAEAGSRACLEPDHSATAAPKSWDLPNPPSGGARGPAHDVHQKDPVANRIGGRSRDRFDWYRRRRGLNRVTRSLPSADGAPHTCVERMELPTLVPGQAS